MLKKVRTVLAAVMFLCITLMFLDFTGSLHHYFAWMAKIQFLPALLAVNVVVIALLLLITLVFGRIYCSIICPLGVMQDILARFNTKKNKYSYSKAISWLRYLMLVIMVGACVAGIGVLMAFLAPYSSYGRIVTHIFQPVWIYGNNILASFAERADSYAFYHVDVWMKGGATLAIAVITFVVIAVLAWKYGRTYCNTICPVGTLLGFFARFSWLKIYFDEEKCKNCSLCSKNCKASCIDYVSHKVDYSRCVSCGNCIAKCKFGALKYGHTSVPKKSAQAEESMNKTDVGKRSFILASALMVGNVIAQDKKKVDGGLAKIEEKAIPKRQTPILPPGAISAQNMAKHCTACQLCVSECPNDVLRPSGEMATLMQPVMSYERGYCRPECNRCSSVCPTGAILPISEEQKSSVQIGHAVWVKKNCVAITDKVECGNCARHCPAGAIEMIPLDENDEDTPFVPAVNENRCIGCGACENLCPARPFPAIYVEGHEVHKEI